MRRDHALVLLRSLPCADLVLRGLAFLKDCRLVLLLLFSNFGGRSRSHLVLSNCDLLSPSLILNLQVRCQCLLILHLLQILLPLRFPRIKLFSFLRPQFLRDSLILLLFIRHNSRFHIILFCLPSSFCLWMFFVAGSGVVIFAIINLAKHFVEIYFVLVLLINDCVLLVRRRC